MLSLAFTGDIAFSKYFKTAYETENLLSDKIIEFLNSANHTVANVEAPVTGAGISAVKPLVHVSDPRISETLKKINATVWNLANNHSMDCGEDGLKDTLKYAQESGAITVGAGINIEQASTPLILEKDGVKVGVVSVSSHFGVAATENNAGCFMWDDFKRIKARVAEVKEKCDYCVVVVHGGEEFSQIPLPYARDKYKRYLKFGADIVVGHHPHVPQNYETFGKKIIFYSLGNFIFDTDYQRTQRNTDIGVLVKINFDKSGYNFDSLAVKINREKNTVEDDELPVIFRNITAKDYQKLLPFADMDYSKNLERKFNFLKQTEKTRTKFKLFRAKVKRLERGERAWAYKALLLRPFKRWKELDKELLAYVGSDQIKY